MSGHSKWANIKRKKGKNDAGTFAERNDGDIGKSYNASKQQLREMETIK